MTLLMMRKNKRFIVRKCLRIKVMLIPRKKMRCYFSMIVNLLTLIQIFKLKQQVFMKKTTNQMKKSKKINNKRKKTMKNSKKCKTLIWKILNKKANMNKSSNSNSRSFLKLPLMKTSNYFSTLILMLNR